MEGKFPSYWGVVISWAVVTFVDLRGLWKEFVLKLALCFGEVGAIVLCDSCGSSWIFLRLVNGDCLKVTRLFGEVGVFVLCDSCGSSWVFLVACERSLFPS